MSCWCLFLPLGCLWPRPTGEAAPPVDLSVAWGCGPTEHFWMRPCWRHPQRVLVVPVHAMESLSCQKPVKAAMNLMKVVVVGVEVALDALQKRQCQPVIVVA